MKKCYQQRKQLKNSGEKWKHLKQKAVVKNPKGFSLKKKQEFLSFNAKKISLSPNKLRLEL